MRVTLQVCKTSVSHEHFKSTKRAFRTRLPPKVTRQLSETSLSYKTSSQSRAGSRIGAHSSSSPAKQFCDSIPSPPSNTRSHANPNVTATFTSTTPCNLTIPCACHENLRVHTSNTHKVLHLPRIVTSATPRNLTIPRTCHENRTSTPQNPHKALRLPRKVIPLSNRQSRCDCAENFRSHKTLRLRSEIILHTSTSYVSTRFLASSHESDTSRFHPKPSPKLPPNGSALALYHERLRTVADGCGRSDNES